MEAVTEKSVAVFFMSFTCKHDSMFCRAALDLYTDVTKLLKKVGFNVAFRSKVG